MKKKLLFLVPLMAIIMTGCVKYNGQGKNGPKSSTEPASQESQNSENPASSEGPVSSESGSQQSSENPTSSQTPSSTPASGENLPAGTAVKVYLVFGEYGKYKGNFVNTSVDSLFLEHTMEYSAKVGEDLPGKADVTSSVEGSKFVAWTAYNNDGKLTEYTKVPATYDKVLYAKFSDGSGQSSSSSSPSGSQSSNPDQSQPSTPSEEKVTVTMNVTYDTGEGSGIYLVGDFCEWSPANNNALKFNWSEGNVWTITKEFYKGTTYRCKLVKAAFEFPSQVTAWEKEGEGNERTITFDSDKTLNFVWGEY